TPGITSSFLTATRAHHPSTRSGSPTGSMNLCGCRLRRHTTWTESFGSFPTSPTEAIGSRPTMCRQSQATSSRLQRSTTKRFRLCGPLSRMLAPRRCRLTPITRSSSHSMRSSRKRELKWRWALRELLQWQATHSCGAQSANVVFHGSAAAKEPDGDKSGAHCQRACTEKLFDAFTWTKEDGCLLLRKGSGSTWKAEPQHGAYSGYPCQQDLVAINWITDEAQKHTLLDGVSPPKSSLTGHGTAGTVLCVMLIQPYTTDIDLVLLQQSHKAGIFSCDQHAVYSSQVLRLSAGLHTRRINDSQMVETGGQWNSALDTDLALAFWRAVVSDPEWLQVKWIVRASAETVFKFDALHSILLKQVALMLV
ncbi:unnamed protein product, partial [Symbiodinium pilosum]